MADLVFDASGITGKEPETTIELAPLITLVLGNLERNSHNPFHIVLNKINPDKRQFVQDYVTHYLKKIFDVWGLTNKKDYQLQTKENGVDELYFIFSPVGEVKVKGQEIMHTHQPTFAPSVVDDIFFKDEYGNLIPFFATPKEKFSNFSKELLTKMEEYLSHPNGRFFEADTHFVDVLNKHFIIETINQENFEKFRDFLPNKVPDFVSHPRIRYWVGLNRKALVRFDNTLYAVKEPSYNYAYAIIISKGDANVVDFLEKLNTISYIAEEKQVD